jgi:uncharacterized protein YcbX
MRLMMQLAGIWRYPVKSMRGESLNAVSLSREGVFGDRIVQVFNGQGRLVTARTHQALLGHNGALGPDDEPTVDGHRWTTAEARSLIEAAVGHGAHFRREDNHRFDILPLLVATDGALAAFGRDARRLRPNLIIGGVSGLQEREWEGRRLRIGDAVIALDDLRARCVMTTFDPDTVSQDPDVLRDIVRRFEGSLCLNASVVTPARVAVGDLVTLL